jgi:hypothetical protein
MQLALEGEWVVISKPPGVLVLSKEEFIRGLQRGEEWRQQQREAVAALEKCLPEVQGECDRLAAALQDRPGTDYHRRVGYESELRSSLKSAHAWLDQARLLMREWSTKAH